MPIWYAIGILITFSPELGKTLGLDPAPKSSLAVMFYYLALTFGDLANGYLSQRLQTRKRIIGIFMALGAVLSGIYLQWGGTSHVFFYAVCAALGFVSGYWAVFVTVAAEQFGTNLRATVAVTAPNFVRGLTSILTWLFDWLAKSWDQRLAAAGVGVLTFLLAAAALVQLEETYGKNLDFYEEL
jgi:MFS family permease